jgi:NADH-quinone oxidoreductase subunit G
LMEQDYLSADLLSEKLSAEKSNLMVLDHTAPAFSKRLDEWRKSAANVVRLSQLGAPDKDEVNLPLSSFSECSGSELNYQALIQSHLPATKPSGQCLPAWHWLVHIGKIRQQPLGDISDLGQLRELLSRSYPQLAAHFVDHHKTQLALQTPRVSGRTAMLANQTVHEPKPYGEADAPYKQSMEGALSGQDKTQPLAYSWSPGWNSNQSNHKFRDEYRGDGIDAQAGVFCVAGTQNNQWFKWQNNWSKSNKAQWQILPLQKVFGSDSLSLQALAIDQLKVPAQIVVSPGQAEKLGYVAGQIVYCDDNPTPLQLVVSPQVPANCVLVYVPADQLFDLQQCEALTLATAKQHEEYLAQAQQLREKQLTQKQAQRDKLLAQDQTIPIHFIEGVV